MTDAPDDQMNGPSSPTSTPKRGLVIGLGACLALFVLLLLAGALRSASRKGENIATVVTSTTVHQKAAASSSSTTTAPTTTSLPPTTTTTAAPTTTTAVQTNPPTINAAEFDAIHAGMTRNQVASIVGSPGEVLSEAGNPGGQYYTVLVTWDGDGAMGGSASASFRDGVLISKSQFNLR